MKKPLDAMIDRTITTVKLEDELVALMLRRGKKHKLSHHEIIGVMSTAHQRMIAHWNTTMQEVAHEEDSKN